MAITTTTRRFIVPLNIRWGGGGNSVAAVKQALKNLEGMRPRGTQLERIGRALERNEAVKLRAGGAEIRHNFETGGWETRIMGKWDDLATN